MALRYPSRCEGCDRLPESDYVHPPCELCRGRFCPDCRTANPIGAIICDTPECVSEWESRVREAREPRGEPRDAWPLAEHFTPRF